MNGGVTITLGTILGAGFGYLNARIIYLIGPLDRLRPVFLAHIIHESGPILPPGANDDAYD